MNKLLPYRIIIKFTHFDMFRGRHHIEAVAFVMIRYTTCIRSKTDPLNSVVVFIQLSLFLLLLFFVVITNLHLSLEEVQY